MKFADVIGHEAIKRRLIRTVKDNRVSHAQLFLGQEGTGNLPLALAYAQFINCTGRTDTDSCGVCPSCIKYEKLIHPDLHIVFPYSKPKEAGHDFESKMFQKWRELMTEKKAYATLTDWYERFGIEKKQAIISAQDCNQIIKTLSYRSFEADYQVVLIWMVEKLYHAAAPRLLKILEEPPDKTLFLLVASNQDLILKTILSRTQLVKISAIADDDLVHGLAVEFSEMGVIHDAVRTSGGNYLIARKQILQMEEGEMNLKWFTQWMRLCFNGKYSDILDFTSDLSKQSRDRLKSFLEYALRIIRHSLLLSTGNEVLAKLSREESDFVIGKGDKKFYPWISLHNAHLINEQLNQSIYHIERNGQAAIILFDLSLKIGGFLKMKPMKQSQ